MVGPGRQGLAFFALKHLPLDIVITCYYIERVSPRIRQLFTFPIDDDLRKALRAVKAEEGISEAEQIRRAIRIWLEHRGTLKKAERKRAATRRRS